MLLIGIDGGASKISGWVVNYHRLLGTYSLSDINSQREYKEYQTFDDSFEPLDINTQLSEVNDEIKLSAEEKRQGISYVFACVDVVLELTKMAKDNNVIIGIGMPGIKTEDKRGIAVMANGPRIPYFLNFFESKLEENGLKLISTIVHLGSDADYCGTGEEFDENGSFRGIQNAYYLGGGTGIADALKLNGKLITFDDSKDWIAKTWEMKVKSGLSFERYISAKGIQEVYSRLADIPMSEINSQQIFPDKILRLAAKGDRFAMGTFKEVGKKIAIVIFERMTTIYFGWKANSDAISYDRVLNNDHMYRNTLLDRIVIGQRLGSLLNQNKRDNLLFNTILDELTQLVLSSTDNKFKSHYLHDNKFDEDILKISNLREAPAIGAAVDAHKNSMVFF